MFCINSARVFRSPRAEGRKKLLKSLKKQNDMKKTGSKFWLRCAIVFILLMLVNGTRWRLFPGDDPEGGNLLVNAAMAAAGTAVYALADWCVRRIRRAVGVDVLTAVCEKFGHKVHYEYAPCGADAIDRVGDPFPEDTYQVCKNSDAVLFSAVGDPKYDNDPTARVRPEQGLLAMRKRLGLYANIRPVQTFKCLLHLSPLRADLVEGADFLCIRELTGGMYFGEKYQDNDKAWDTNYYTRPEIERILRVAFEYARRRRHHLTVVDKANVLASSRLWRQIAQEMAPQWPDVTTDYMFVDNAAMKMIQQPGFFDVIVTENTFGDILTDEGSVISGSMGLLPSASTGDSTPVFEPIHGSWPQAKGQNIANPLAQVLSVAMLLEHFDLREEGALVRRAVDASLDACVRTPEIQVPGGAHYGTREVGQWLVDYIRG